MNIALLLFVYSCTLLSAIRAAVSVLVSVDGAAPQDKQVVRTVCSNPPTKNDKVRVTFQDLHNNIRKDLATGKVEDYGGRLPGSTNLFMMSYNCELEGLALALTRACIPPGEMSKVIAGKSINYEIIRKHSGTPSDDDAVEDIKQLMEKWKDSRYNVNFNKSTVIYGDENAAPFARIVYKRSISLGCAVTYCPPKRTAYTCAYSESPVIGEPLYSPSKKSTGCTSNSQCRKAIPGSSTFCNTHLNLCTTSLLALNDSTSTVATTEPQTTVESTAAKTSSAASQSTATAENSQSTAAATTSQTTTAATTSQTTAAATTSQTTAAATTSQTTAAATTSQTTAAATTSQTTAAASVTTPADSSGVMTDAIRQLVVDKHNTDRSLLAQGAIRNGKPGKPNLGPATNMLRMRYDIALEAKAQAYANTCALTKSAVSTRPDSGENTNVIQSTTIAISDALTRSMQTWWNQISINGLNAKLLYTSTLDTRSNAPLEFTQMAWATTYKVGCGVSRCSSSTFVVCRYNPRGNIIGEHIYMVGSNCLTCLNSCRDALCATPSQ